MISNKTSKSFLFWVLYLPAAICLFVYILELFFKVNRWFFAEPESLASSPRYIFLDRYSSVGEFLRAELSAFVFGAMLGFGIWLYTKYKTSKNKAP